MVVFTLGRYHHRYTELLTVMMILEGKSVDLLKSQNGFT